MLLRLVLLTAEGTAISILEASGGENPGKDWECP
jgi:hypothetical protein